MWSHNIKDDLFTPSGLFYTNSVGPVHFNVASVWLVFIVTMFDRTSFDVSDER